MRLPVLFLAIYTLFFGVSAAFAETELWNKEQLLHEKSSGNKMLILDVRSPGEYERGHVPGAINIPHNQVKNRLSEIIEYKDQTVVVYCRSGRRAGMAESVLEASGFTQLKHLEGDWLGWEASKQPSDL
jgi:rhodanese-related sulfurtransferase